jgi:hypothetical protein
MRWIVPFLIAIAPAPLAYSGGALAQSINITSSDRFAYVLFTDNGNSSMMSGSSEDIRRARALRAGNAPMLYVREGGVAYVIRDPAILARARAIMAPQQELGRRQGALGNQQGELGRRQGRLGAEQGRLGAMMADARMREMGELGRRQAALGQQQAALGQQQAALGARQAELGRQQARLAELAQPQFRALVAQAIRRGVAQRIK